MCASLDDAVNPCELISLQPAMNHFNTETFMYAVTTTSIFINSPASDDDGMLDPPSGTSDGTLS